jgi:signal transduction histidine kinase
LKEAEVKTWFNSLSPHLELVIADPRIRSDITELIDGEHDEILLAGWRSLLLDTLGIALIAGSEFDELFLMDTKGTVIVATNPSREGGTFQVQPFFKQGLNAPYVQSPFYSLLHDKMVVFAAVPVRDESGITRGVLAGVTDLDTLNDIMLERAGLGQNGETYLVNSDYIMLTEPRSTQSGEFPAVRTVGADQALSGVNGAELYENYEYPAVPVVGVYRWIPELNVALLAEQSQTEAFAATSQYILITLATTVIAALITAGAAILVTRRIARPLAHLTSIAAQAAGGDLTQMAPIERGDEIGTLAAAFNTMTLQLRDLIEGLERRVADRTRELATINAIAGVVSRSLDLDEILSNALDETLALLDLEAGDILLIEPGEQYLIPRVRQGFSEEFLQAVPRVHLDEGISGQAMAQRKPVVLDVTDYAQEEFTEHLAPSVVKEGIQTLASTPLLHKGQVLGVMTLATRRPRAFPPEELELLTAIGQQIGVAVENGRLFEAEQRRAEEFRALADASRIISSVLDKDQLLRALYEQITRIAPTDFYAIALYDEAANVVSIEINVDEGVHYPKEQYVLDKGLLKLIIHDRQALRFDSLTEEIDSLDVEIVPSGSTKVSHGWLGVPMLYGDKVLGAIVVGSYERGAFDEGHQQTLSSIAHQAAVALENARLYEQAQQELTERKRAEEELRQSEMEKAVAAERNRLARDLHDSVTQSLFAVTLYADAAAQLVSSGQMDLVAGNVRKLRRTAKEALGEMRLLVFELRPPLLKQEGLVAALQARLESVEGRAGLETLLKVEGKGRLAPDVEQALYRITQEALNNIFKHAQARNITVSLRLAEHPQTTILEIADDGIGFDPSAVQGRGGLGLRGMAERVEQLGGQLRIKSEPGAGTIVQVEVHQ